MVQASVQFTPVQVLQAARRAEAEGKMDYALQFYRHLVEQHGNTVEAQEAREGLFRIAEWRWGEARVARGREAAAAGGQPQPVAQPQPPPAAHDMAAKRVYTGAPASPPPASPYFPDQSVGAHPTKLPQIISREHGQRPAEEPPHFEARFQVAKFFAHALSALGWLTVLAGIGGAGAGAVGFIGELSALALLGLPVGIVVGVPAVLFGLMLIVGGQLAAAVFASTNATLEMLSLERGRTAG